MFQCRLLGQSLRDLAGKNANNVEFLCYRDASSELFNQVQIMDQEGLCKTASTSTNVCYRCRGYAFSSVAHPGSEAKMLGGSGYIYWHHAEKTQELIFFIDQYRYSILTLRVLPSALKISRLGKMFPVPTVV
jgi:hypothetical protein